MILESATSKDINPIIQYNIKNANLIYIVKQSHKATSYNLLYIITDRWTNDFLTFL